MEDLTGKNIDRYEITGLIASGGMAYVYRACDPHLNRVVAIKLVRAESFTPDELPTLLERFKNEAKIIANLSHPNIVKVFDYGEYEGVPYLVMELVEGKTLRSLLTKPIDYSDAAELLIPLADALSYMHENGLLHRDIKPSNIIISVTPYVQPYVWISLLNLINDCPQKFLNVHLIFPTFRF